MYEKPWRKVRRKEVPLRLPVLSLDLSMMTFSRFPFGFLAGRLLSSSRASEERSTAGKVVGTLILDDFSILLRDPSRDPPRNKIDLVTR